MTTEALGAGGRGAGGRDGQGGEIVLPQVIVDAGPATGGGIWSSSRGGSRTRGRGRRTGGR